MSDAKSEITPPLRADDLAARINAAHEEVKTSIRRGAEHAIKAGPLAPITSPRPALWCALNPWSAVRSALLAARSACAE